MNQHIHITTIVPFYNEAGRIGPVLTFLKKSKHITEIIAVDDGSTDSSFLEAQAISGVNIVQQENQGKSAAVQTGLIHVKTKYILLFDADSGGMSVSELDRGLLLLEQPVAQVIGEGGEGNINMVLFFKRQSRLANPIGTDFLTGNRVLLTEDLQQVFSQYQSNGFSLETDINDYAYQHKRDVVWIQTKVRHQTKVKKYGVVKGVVGSLSMFSDLREAGTLQKIKQWKKAWPEAI